MSNDERRKIDQPETRREAERWVTIKARYLDAGLCHRCAAQAAYGVQLGWSLIEPPCRDCAPLVATFPIDKAGVWRAVPGDAVRFRSPDDASEVSPDPARLVRSSDRESER